MLAILLACLFSIMAILVSMKWYLIMVLICISLMTNESFPSDSAVKNLPATQEMQERWVQSLDRDDFVEEGMSSILAGKIPCTEEPGCLQSMGCKESDKTEGACMQQWLMMFSIFSYAYWPLTYLLWRNVYSSPLPICFISIASHLLYFLILKIFSLHHMARGVLFPLLRIEPVPPAVELQSPKPWTTREFPVLCPFLNWVVCFFVVEL